MYGNEKEISYPTFKGRTKANAPFPLGGRSRWANSRPTWDISNGGLAQSIAADSDIRGFYLPDDDEADTGSGYGSYGDSGE